MKKEGIQTRKRKQKNSGSGSASNGTSNEIPNPNPKPTKYSKSSNSSSSRKSAKLSTNGNLMSKLSDVQVTTNLTNHYGDGNFNSNGLEVMNNSEDIQRSLIVNNNEK